MAAKSLTALLAVICVVEAFALGWAYSRPHTDCGWTDVSKVYIEPPGGQASLLYRCAGDDWRPLTKDVVYGTPPWWKEAQR